MSTYRIVYQAARRAGLSPAKSAIAGSDACGGGIAPGDQGNPFIEHPAEYRERTEKDDWVQWLFSFPNGHGASVVCGAGTYGYPHCWELAVVDHDGNLDYTTPVTSDVLGWLTETDVIGYLTAIALLPATAKELSHEG